MRNKERNRITLISTNFTLKKNQSTSKMHKKKLCIYYS